MFIKGHISGIYKIICLSTGKIYIGSSVNIHDRWSVHKCELRSNKHGNKYLQKAWNKYGEQNFEWQILQPVESELLMAMELEWFNKTQCCDPKYGFNMSKNPNNVMLGRKHNEQSKLKMSNAHKGKFLTDKHKNNIRNYRIGQKQTEETRQKIGIAHRGKKVSTKTIENMKKAQKGLHLGIKNSKAFLTEKIVKNIRIDYSNGIKPKYLIIKYNLKRSHIKKIISNQIWRHI